MPLDQDGGLLGEVASAPQLQALPSSRPRRCQPHAPRPTSRTVITTCKLERESAQVVLIASCAKGINYPFVGADGVGELAEGLARVLVATVVAEAKNPLVVASPATPQMKLLVLAKVNQPPARGCGRPCVADGHTGTRQIYTQHCDLVFTSSGTPGWCSGTGSPGGWS
jgi:hypothetical protein